MQVQDEVLFASAVIWDLNDPTAVAWLRTEASGLTSIVYSHAATIPCSGALGCSPVMVRRQVERRL